MLKRIGDLGDLLDSGYGYEDIIRGVQRSTQYTYEALFGTVYFGPDEKYLFKNLDARVRFQRVRGTDGVTGTISSLAFYVVD